MDQMRLSSGLLSNIISKIIRRYLIKKFNTNGFVVDIESLDVDMTESIGKFSLKATGTFTYSDIYKLLKLSGGSNESE